MEFTSAIAFRFAGSAEWVIFLPQLWEREKVRDSMLQYTYSYILIFLALSCEFKLQTSNNGEFHIRSNELFILRLPMDGLCIAYIDFGCN